MSNKKKINNRLLKISIILYAVLIAVVGVFSVAWFVTNKRVEIGVNEEISLAVGNNLEFALVEDATKDPDWRSKIVLSPKSDRNYPDVTAGLVGDELKFYYPTVLDDHDNVLPNSEYLSELTGDEGYYIQLRLKFRASVNMGVYLTDESFVKPIKTSKIDSAYGEISTDYIAGAARIAFSEITETDADGKILKETLKNVWIPNDKYELYYKEVDTTVEGQTVKTTRAFVDDDGKRESFYRDVTDENDPNYNNAAPYGYLSVVNNQIRYNAWAEEDYCKKLVTVGNSLLASSGLDNEPVINSAKELLTFTSDGTLQEKELMVRIWFEGTDREADKALNGGKVNYNLTFLGIDKKEASEENETKLNSLAYGVDGKLYLNSEPATEKDNLLYSYNGIDWNSYSPTGSNVAPLKDNEKNYVYVRIRETTTNKETNYVKLFKQGV